MRDKNEFDLPGVLRARAERRKDQSLYQRLLCAMEDIADSVKAIELAVLASLAADSADLKETKGRRRSEKVAPRSGH